MLIVCVMYCRLASRAVEIDQLRAEKSTVEQSLVEQQRKVADDEGRVANAVAKLKDSFQLAENAVVERDQVGFCASFFDFLLLIFVVNTSKSYCLGDLSPKCVEWDIKPYSLTNQTSNWWSFRMLSANHGGRQLQTTVLFAGVRMLQQFLNVCLCGLAQQK